MGNLSPREMEVMHLIRIGKTSREIADTLHIARGTVDFHSKSVFRKLGVHSRTQAVHAIFGKAQQAMYTIKAALILSGNSVAKYTHTSDTIYVVRYVMAADSYLCSSIWEGDYAHSCLCQGYGECVQWVTSMGIEEHARVWEPV